MSLQCVKQHRSLFAKGWPGESWGQSPTCKTWMHAPAISRAMTLNQIRAGIESFFNETYFTKNDSTEKSLEIISVNVATHHEVKITYWTGSTSLKATLWSWISIMGFHWPPYRPVYRAIYKNPPATGFDLGSSDWNHWIGRITLKENFIKNLLLLDSIPSFNDHNPTLGLAPIITPHWDWLHL